MQLQQFQCVTATILPVADPREAPYNCENRRGLQVVLAAQAKSGVGDRVDKDARFHAMWCSPG